MLSKQLSKIHHDANCLIDTLLQIEEQMWELLEGKAHQTRVKYQEEGGGCKGNASINGKRVPPIHTHSPVGSNGCIQLSGRVARSDARRPLRLLQSYEKTLKIALETQGNNIEWMS